MAGRPFSSATLTNFTAQGTGTLNNIPQLDTNMTTLLADINDSATGYVNYAADTGSANAYVVTLAQAPSAYVAGLTVAMLVANSNTGASNINVNSLGSKAIVNKANLALSGGELIANKLCILIYDGTSFRIASYCGLSYSATNPGNVTINCAGYDAVSAFVGYTVSTSTSLLLKNLGYGVVVSVAFNNGYSTALAYGIQATDPTNTGTTCSITWAPKTSISGGARVLFQSGATVNAQSLTNSFAVAFCAVTRQLSGPNLQLDF